MQVVSPMNDQAVQVRKLLEALANLDFDQFNGFRIVGIAEALLQLASLDQAVGRSTMSVWA